MPQIIIDMTALQAQRIANAYRVLVGPNDTDPSLPILKAFLIQQLRDLVNRYERQQAVRAASEGSSTPFDPT